MLTEGIVRGDWGQRPSGSLGSVITTYLIIGPSLPVRLANGAWWAN